MYDRSADLLIFEFYSFIGYMDNQKFGLVIGTFQSNLPKRWPITKPSF